MIPVSNCRHLAVLAAGLFLCASAPAQYVGGSIPIMSTFSHSSSVTVADTNPIYLVRVTLNGLAHGRSGDLHIILSHTIPVPFSETSVDLFSRPGVSATSPLGATSSTSGDYGFSDNAPITFSAAAIAAGNGQVPNDIYHPSQSDGTATPVLSYLAIFNGQTATGTWTLDVSDGAADYDGSLDGWRLNLVTIRPQLSLSLTPTNAALLSWPTNPDGFILQANTNLLATNGWTNITTSVNIVNGTNQVPSAPVIGNSFFRLYHP